MSHQRDLERAVEIGHECLAITAAIDQYTVAWRNGHSSTVKFDVYDTEFFRTLSARREQLWAELLELAF